MTSWTAKMRGSKAEQDGVPVPGTGRILTYNFRGLLTEYDAGTGKLSVGPEASTTRAEVHAATTAALPANTRVGNTLTANANGALAAIDGVTLTTNNRLLVKNEVTTANNGWYFVADPGSAGSPWQLTRTTDADASAEFVSGSTSRVLAGTANVGKRFVLTVGGGFVLNTDAVTFTEYNADAISPGSELGQKPEFNGTTFVPRRFWITPDVDVTGVSDATAAINAALAARNGGCVYLPDGIIRINGQLTMARGTALVGRINGMHFGHKQYDVAANIGTMVNVYGTSAAILPHEQCTIDSLTFYYPTQNTNSAPSAFGYTIDAPLGSGVHGLTILNVTGINPEKFIRVCVNGARLDNIQGAPLRRGIDLGRCADVVRVSNVHFNAGGVFGPGVSGATLIAWVLANGTAFSVDGAEAFDFSACFPGGYLIGLDFSDVDADSQTSYGHWRGGGIEGCPTAIRVHSDVCLATLNLSDANIAGASAGSHIIDFQDTTAPVDRPRIFASNVSFWGSSNAIVNMNNSSVGRYVQHGGAAFGYTGAAFRTGTNTVPVLRLSGVGTQTSSRTSGSGDILDTGGWLT
jgi:hypothetical protein